MIGEELRLIDAEVAEKLMEWKLVNELLWVDSAQQIVSNNYAWSPSSTMDSAWVVVERLQELGVELLVKAYPGETEHRYSASVPATSIDAQATTASLAICQAALEVIAASSPPPALRLVRAPS